MGSIRPESCEQHTLTDGDAARERPQLRQRRKLGPGQGLHHHLLLQHLVCGLVKTEHTEDVSMFNPIARTSTRTSSSPTSGSLSCFSRHEIFPSSGSPRSPQIGACLACEDALRIRSSCTRAAPRQSSGEQRRWRDQGSEGRRRTTLMSVGGGGETLKSSLTGFILREVRYAPLTPTLRDSMKSTSYETRARGSNSAFRSRGACWRASPSSACRHAPSDPE